MDVFITYALTFRFSTYTAPQNTYAASMILCLTDRTGVQPRPQPKPALTDFGLQPYVDPVCRFNSLVSSCPGE